MMVRDPDPGTLLRITICQRNKDHWLGSYVRIISHKNPALTAFKRLDPETRTFKTTTQDSQEVSSGSVTMSSKYPCFKDLIK